MKKVFSSNSEVCHVFASQTQDEGRSHTVFFEDGVLYSYGRHFPMAVFSEDNKTVYFTTRSYSSSTSQHLGYAGHALNHFPKVYCFDPEQAKKGYHSGNLKNFNQMAKGSAMKLRNAHKPEIYLNQIAGQKQSFTKYCEHFKIRLTKKLQNKLPHLFIESKDGGKIATEKEVRAIAKENKERIKREAQQHAIELKDFRNFECLRMYNRNGFDYLRYNKERNKIETSQGITIDTIEAKRVYKLVLASIDRGGCTDCGTIDNIYKINSVSSEFLVVGCHNIPISEVVSIGQLLFKVPAG